jgi:hypothetical protein
MDIVGAVTECIGAWQMTYKHHVCCEEVQGDAVCADYAIEDSTRRFLVRLR